MTISTTSNQVEYNTDGATANFAVNFEFLSAGSLRVFVVTSAGVATLQTLGSDYTVSGGGEAGGPPAQGTVMFNAAPAAGQTVEIYRWENPVQLVDLTNTGRLDVETLERMGDIGTILAQQALSRTGGSDFDRRAARLLLLSSAGSAWDARSLRITGVADAVDADDAVSKAQMDALVVAAGNLPLPSVGQIGLSLVAVADATSATGARFEIRAVKASDVAGLGTAASEDVGTAAGQIALLGSGGVFDSDLIDTGTTDGKIVQVDSNDELPPVLLPVASDAQMAAASVDNRAATPANLRSSPYTAVAWGVINQIGTQTLVEGVGIDSISDEGTGDTEVTLADAMADANYVAIAMAQDSTIIGVDTFTASSFRIKCRNGANTSVDRDGVRFVVFGVLA